MRTIAVAGGTSPSLGRAIVTAIGKTSNKPIILSRTTHELRPQTSKYGAEIRYVDYSQPDSLVSALRNIHTVISVMKVPGPEWATHQLALLSACQNAGVKRFAPSDFECGPQADGRVDILNSKQAVRDACRKSGMECTRFCNSMFMNYLAQGFDFSDDEQHKERMLEGLDDMSIIWDIGNGVAEIPVNEDWNTPLLTMTTIGDVGRFVAAACELPDGMWVPTMSMVGETLRVSEVTALIEDIVGLKLEVRTVSYAELQRRVASVAGIGTDRESVTKKMVAQMEILMLEGKMVLEPVVNELCPLVKPTGVREYLEMLVR